MSFLVAKGKTFVRDRASRILGSQQWRGSQRTLRWREMDSNHRSLSRPSRFILRKVNCAGIDGRPKKFGGVPMVRIHLPPAESQQTFGPSKWTGPPTSRRFSGAEVVDDAGHQSAIAVTAEEDRDHPFPDRPARNNLALAWLLGIRNWRPHRCLPPIAAVSPSPVPAAAADYPPPYNAVPSVTPTVPTAAPDTNSYEQGQQQYRQAEQQYQRQLELQRAQQGR